MSLSSLYNIQPQSNPAHQSELQKLYFTNSSSEEQSLQLNGLNALYGFATPVNQQVNTTIYYDDKKIKKQKKPTYIYPKYSKNYSK